MGGGPLFSIERGRGDMDRAGRIMGNSFSMLLLSGLILIILCNLFKRPMLYLFGASDQTYPYASAYITVYLCGTLFVMISLGMNFFINAQAVSYTHLDVYKRQVIVLFFLFVLLCIFVEVIVLLSLIHISPSAMP